MRLTCAIIDDEPLAVSLLESYVLKTPFLDLQGTYNSALDALSDLRDRPVDLLFLDIQMPELSGLEFSRILNADTRVIFTTAFDQYAVDSYRVNALDYLLKPISYPDFLASANKALRWYELLRKPVSSEEKEESAPIAEKGGMESIFVKSEYKLLQIELRKILYIEGLKDYVKIFVEDEEFGGYVTFGSLCACSSLFYRPAGEDQGDRAEPDCLWKGVYSDLRQL